MRNFTIPKHRPAIYSVLVSGSPHPVWDFDCLDWGGEFLVRHDRLRILISGRLWVSKHTFSMEQLQ